MIDIKGPRISYGYVISHIFPGTFFVFQIFAYIELVSPLKVRDILFYKMALLDLKGFSLFLMIFAVIIFLGAFTGMIIDCIQHLIFDLLERYNLLKVHGVNEIAKKIKSKEQLDIYEQIVNEEYYLFYEAYANTALSLIPLVFILSATIDWLKVDACCIKPLAIFGIIALIIFLCIESVITFKHYREREKVLFENWEK